MYLKLEGYFQCNMDKDSPGNTFFFSPKFPGTNKVEKGSRKRIKEEDDLSYSGGIEQSG